MAQMNREWATQKLQNFLTTSRSQYVQSPPDVIAPGYFKLVASESDVQREAQVIEQILDRVVPDWRIADWEKQGKSQPFWRHRIATDRAIAQLEAEQELADNLGDNAPQLDAATLHPWGWEAARGLWRSGHFRDAVVAASRQINAEAQNKLGRRDASEAKLLSDAFSTNPPQPGHPRLRLGNDDGSDTFKNRHEGAANFARGLYMAIRNPSAHEILDELDEHEALEQVASFSILARWVEDAVIENAPSNASG